ncbi:DNA-directed RNA polymerase subunit RPC12/RpoP [Ralstonia pickettii]
MATYVGQCACQQCGDPVQVYTDRAGMAYYRCGPCGAHVRQTKPTKTVVFWNQSSATWMRMTRLQIPGKRRKVQPRQPQP